MVFGEINAFFSVLDRFKNKASESNSKHNKKEENIATRFIYLLESHGVHRNQIPRFLNIGLTIADVQDDQTLLKKLNEDILDSVCEKFAVRREWLDGASKRIYSKHDFYKQPEVFLEFLNGLLKNAVGEHISGFLITSKKKYGVNTILLFQETIDHVGSNPIYRYHLCEATTFHYWKSRAYTTVCVAKAWQKKIFVYGSYLSQNIIDSMAHGEYMFGWSGEGVWALKGKKWYPEDMTFDPDSFLKDIDPEKDNYGKKAALALWLELEEQGYMDSGLKKYAKDLFEKKLSDLR